ncbi:zinc finger protein 502 [Neodiprion lecontei]|uniref:Zinc finger protein 502 n=1 Tax=Neodiprion lecontei TaxID=441921 RepID=A0A6J0CBT9_NEOLC|nr:zinc finger protein 502 [Neodiprion lecontei]
MEMEVEKIETAECVSQVQLASIQECRICLKNCNQFWELFQNDEDIPRKIMAFAAIQVEHGDGLPSVICFSCRQLLDMSYDFKCQVEKSDAALRKILLSNVKVNGDAAKELLSQSINDVITEAIADEIPNQQTGIKELEMQSVSKSQAAQEMKRVVLTNFDDKQSTVAFEISEECMSGNESSQEEEMQDKSLSDESIDKQIEKDDDFSQREIISALESTEILLDDQGVTVGKLIDSTDQNIEPEPIKQEDMPLSEECELLEGERNNQDEIIFHDDLKFELKNSLLSEGEDEADVSSESGKLKPNNCQIFNEEMNDSDEEKPLITRTSRRKCPHCIKSFATNLALQRHMTIHKHKTKLRYVCYLCDKQFSTVAKLKNHVSDNHDSLKNDNRVDIDNNCGAIDTDRKGEKLEKDIDISIYKQKTDKKNYKMKCKVCAKQFTYQKSFLSHIKTHPEYEKCENSDNHSMPLTTIEESLEHQTDSSHSKINESDDDDLPLEGLQCTQCGKLFATKGNLKRHISTHSGLRFNCSTCGKEFSRLDKLKDHEQSKHKAEIFGASDDEDEDTDNESRPNEGAESKRKEKKCRPHQCAMCPKAFAQAQSLANHMERHKRIKEPQKRFLCEVCSKCFAQSGSLVAHMRTHTGIKPYVCNVCSRAFTKSTYLQLHLRTHSGEKPYICQYCSRAFARANTLARHITMHTGEAKYHCQICMKSFRRLTSLNEHTYTHTGQRPYACKICSKRYNNAGSLYAHTKKCRAQQLSGSASTYTVAVDNANQNDVSTVPQMLIYSQRKIVPSEPQAAQPPTPQYLVTTVQSQKTLPTHISQSFSVGDPHFYAIDGKQLKNPYYTIYPNM